MYTYVENNNIRFSNIIESYTEGAFFWDIGRVSEGKVHPLYGAKSCRDSLGMDVIYKAVKTPLRFGEYMLNHRYFNRNFKGKTTEDELVFLVYFRENSNQSKSKNVQSILLDKILNPLDGDRPTRLIINEYYPGVTVLGFSIDDKWWRSTVSILLYTFLIRGFFQVSDVTKLTRANDLVDWLTKKGKEIYITNNGRTFQYLTVEEFLLNMDEILGDHPLTGNDDPTYLRVAETLSYDNCKIDQMSKQIYFSGSEFTINEVASKSPSKYITANDYFGGMGPVGLSSIVYSYINDLKGLDSTKLKTHNNPISLCKFPIWASNLVNLIYRIKPELKPVPVPVSLQAKFKKSALSIK